MHSASTISYKVSIIIPVYNKLKYTKECIESIIHNTDIPYEIIIIDNNSTDGTKELFSNLTEYIQLISNNENAGFVKACNQGAEAAKGEYLVFLNNDTTVQDGWLRELIAIAENDLAAGVVGAKLIYPNGQLQEAGGIIWNDGSGWNYGRGDNQHKPQYNYVREVDYCSGACILISKKLFKEIGGFDIRYSPGYYEDTDLCFTVRKLGRKVIYNPKAMVIHHEGVSAGTDLASGMKQYQQINHGKFASKWQNELAAQYAPSIQNVCAAATRTNGKNILVVDPYMPVYDRASGSLRLFNILKLLRNQGHFITYIAHDGRNQKRYAEILERLGIEVFSADSNKMKSLGYNETNGWLINLHNILTSKFYDFAWLSFYYIAEQYLAAIKYISPATKALIDSVDVHYLRETRQAELCGDPNLMASAKETKRRELNMYNQADLVVTVTEDDKLVLQKEKISPKITVISNIHDTLATTNSFKNRSGILFVGNFSHTPNLDAMNYFVADIWPIVKNKLSDVKIYIVGNRSDEFCKYDDQDIIVTGFVPDTAPYLQQCRVSIAPLRYGAGMKGKIGEAIASGIPVVTSSIGSEGMYLTNKEHVLVADDPQNFAAAIISLYNDERLWQQLVHNSTAHLNAFCSSQAVTQKLQVLLTQ